MFHGMELSKNKKGIKGWRFLETHCSNTLLITSPELNLLRGPIIHYSFVMQLFIVTWLLLILSAIASLYIVKNIVPLSFANAVV